MLLTGYIIRQCKKAHFCGWTDEGLQMCIDKAKVLSRKELFQLFNSKWLDNDDPFRKELFILLHKEELEKVIVPTSVTRMHTNWYMFRKENVEEYTIGNNEVIDVFHFEGYEKLKKVNIRSNFIIDDDYYTRFGRFTPNLEQFHVISKQSPFFTEDGVLYMNIDKAREREEETGERNNHLWNCDIFDNLSGNMLVAMPPKYKDVSFVIPNFVEVIGCFAFCGSNLEKLTIPNSVIQIGIGGLGEMEHLKELRVPNLNICIQWDHNYIGHDIDILCSQTDVELKPEIRDFWQHLLVEDKYDRGISEPIMPELGINERQLIQDSSFELPF